MSLFQNHLKLTVRRFGYQSGIALLSSACHAALLQAEGAAHFTVLNGPQRKIIV